MKKFDFSSSQQRVLDCKNKNILVSASAGTGKTTVMIERIANSILSGETRLDRLLVVTFTEMAAYEMKKRLADKLSASKDKDVLNQLSKIELCDISTLHSFCANLIRKYFSEAEIDPAYKILSDTEWNLAFGSCLDKLFDRLYASKDAEFLALAEIFASGRTDDSLKDAVKNLYSFMICKADFDGWLASLAKKNQNRADNFYLQKTAEQMANEFFEMREKLFEFSAEAKKIGLEKYADYCLAAAESIFISPSKTLSQNVAELKNMATFATLPKIVKDADFLQTEFKERLSAFMKGCRDTLKIYSEVFADDEEVLAMRVSKSFDMCVSLFGIVKSLKNEFDEYKKQNGLLDFNDLEHKAFKVLSIEKIRLEVQSKFEYVYVDEYQDINEIQESIISLVKRRDNLFLVGDVKQSIYAFRQCDPEIFTDKISAFSNEAEANHVDFFNDNFRSDEKILNFVNSVFGRIMSEVKGGVDYASTSMLKGKGVSGTPLSSVTVDVIDFKKPAQEVESKIYSVRERKEKSFDKADAEAQLIFKRIREIVGLKMKIGDAVRVVTYSDIVILSRDMTNHAKSVISRLEKLGVPLNYSVKKSVFDGIETKQLTNLFKVIDNPDQDIPLAGCLSGWFCGLDDNEISQVALSKTEEELYIKVIDYVKNNDDEIKQKLEKFLSFVSDMRFLAQSMPVSSLISEIFSKTDFALKTLGLPDGDIRLKKINEFSNSLIGKTYDRSVAEFLAFMKNSQADAETENTKSVSAVRVMTIHKSKGLEFPIVFVINCGKRFKKTSSAVVCDRREGIAAKFFDRENRIVYDTLSRLYVLKKVNEKALYEEARLFYVAMTRAKAHLYLCGCGDQSDGEKSYFDWILPYLDQFDKEKCGLRYGVVDANELMQDCEKNERVLPSYSACDEKAAKTLREKIYAAYPHEEATRLELKAVSSNLQPYLGFAGEEETQASNIVIDDERVARNEIGSAYHKIFEKIDFSKISEQEVKRVIDQEVTKGEISKEAADSLSAEFVLKVLSNPLFKDISKKTVYRELPFMLKTAYNNLFDDRKVDENIFLQGVIDLLILDGDKAVIVDYKYSRNSDYLKNKYGKQLNSYAQAVREILRVDDVEKYILSIADGKLIKM